MANLKIAYTDQGPILGDYTATNTSRGVVYQVEGPLLLQQMGQQLGFIPILGFTTAKFLKLPETDIKYTGELFEARQELQDHWNSQFGAGIVLATSPSPIARR